jgi:hypothetical protein
LPTQRAFDFVFWNQRLAAPSQMWLEDLPRGSKPTEPLTEQATARHHTGSPQTCGPSFEASRSSSDTQDGSVVAPVMSEAKGGRDGNPTKVVNPTEVATALRPVASPTEVTTVLRPIASPTEVINVALINQVLERGVITAATKDPLVGPADLEQLDQMRTKNREWNLNMIASTLMLGIALSLLLSGPLERHPSWETPADDPTLDALEYWYIGALSTSVGFSCMVIVNLLQYFYYVLSLAEKVDLIMLYEVVVQNKWMHLSMPAAICSMSLALPPGLLALYGLGKGLFGTAIVLLFFFAQFVSARRMHMIMNLEGADLTQEEVDGEKLKSPTVSPAARARTVMDGPTA